MTSEFQDEYQDWMDGSEEYHRQAILDRPIGTLSFGKLAFVGSKATVMEAVSKMNENKTGCVLIMADQNPAGEGAVHLQIKGIFTERDVVTRVLPSGADMSQTPVAEFMTPDPATVTGDALLAQALRTMATQGYRHIPVVDDDSTPLGVVSMRQIVQHLVDLFPTEIMNAPPEGQRYPLTAEGA